MMEPVVQGVLLALIAAPIAWLWNSMSKLRERVDAREADTYTKAEVDKLIDLKLQPLINSVDHNTRVNEKLVEAITDLRIAVAKLTEKE